MEDAISRFDEQDNRPIKLFFEDEARFGRISQTVRCWAPPSKRPTVTKQHIREYLYVYSAICPWNGESFSLILPYTNSKTMEVFLRELSKFYKEYRIVLVTDNARWHPKEDYQKQENLRIIHQPPYSPEVNPVEHLWDHIRENYLKNRTFESLSSIEEELVSILRELHNDKSTVQSLTGFNWTFFNV